MARQKKNTNDLRLMVTFTLARDTMRLLDQLCELRHTSRGKVLDALVADAIDALVATGVVERETNEVEEERE